MTSKQRGLEDRRAAAVERETERIERLQLTLEGTPSRVVPCARLMPDDSVRLTYWDLSTETEYRGEPKR